MQDTTTNQASNDQLNSLLTQSNGTPLVDINKTMEQLMPLMIVLTVLSIVLTVLWIIHIIQRMRVNKAILETRDLLREMNEREKTRTDTSKPTASTSELVSHDSQITPPIAPTENTSPNN